MNMTRSINPSFWQDKRVLATGHTGFKGAWLCLILARLKCRVTGLSLPPEEPSLFSQAGVAELLEGNYFVDLGDAEAVEKVVQAAQPEIVFHFAAQSLVRRAYHEPKATFATNVLGTAHLLDALRRCDSVETILVTTTDKVYLNLEDGRPFREGDRLGGFESYSASKVGQEMVISAYRASYFEPRGVSVLVTRAGNVIGGGDWSQDRILPDIIRAVMSGEAARVRNPQSVRPWQLVLEALEGYLLLVEAKGRGLGKSRDFDDMAWNFGPRATDETVTVEQICRWVKDYWPDRFSWVAEPDKSGVKESGLLLLDPGKAIADLGWAPRFGPKAAVEQTLAWYARFLAGESAAAISMDQIEAHFPALGGVDPAIAAQRREVL